MILVIGVVIVFWDDQVVKMMTKILSIYLLLIGLSALYGGWAIIYTDVMDFPPGFLNSTPFRSFLIPGLILAFVVGGTQLFAAFMLWMRKRFMYEATAVAGFCLLIWMTTEIYMIPTHHPIQIVYLGLAMITLISLLFLIKYQPQK